MSLNKLREMFAKVKTDIWWVEHNKVLCAYVCTYNLVALTPRYIVISQPNVQYFLSCDTSLELSWRGDSNDVSLDNIALRHTERGHKILI